MTSWSGGGTGTPATGGTAVVTLADIEQEVGRRVGPFLLTSQSALTAAIAGACYVDLLTSSLDLGGYTDLWLLRRGRKTDGTAVVGFSSADRQRRVDEFDPSTGALSIDRDWATPPVATEEIELHHLDPANELRRAVLAGLKRCFMVDRSSVTLAASGAERSLTAGAAWITDPAQVLGLQYLPSGSTALPIPQWWDRIFMTGGVVWLGLDPDPYPSTLLVTSKRAHFTWVNGTTTTVGPTDDADELAVDVNYAAAWAHVEAWRLAYDKLADAANEGKRPKLAEVVADAELQAITHYKPPPADWQLSEPFTLGAGNGWLSRNALW